MQAYDFIDEKKIAYDFNAMQLNLPDAGISTGFEFDSQRNFPYIDPHTRSYKGEEKAQNDPIRISKAFPNRNKG